MVKHANVNLVYESSSPGQTYFSDDSRIKLETAENFLSQPTVFSVFLGLPEEALAPPIFKCLNQALEIS